MDSNDNLIWYSEPHFQHGDIVCTFRHAECLQLSYKVMMENSTCKFCFSIVTLNSFRKRLQRRHKQECIDSPSKKEAVNYKYCERNDLLKVLNEKGEKIQTLENKCTLLKFENLRLLNHKQGWKIKMKNLANGNDGAVREVASILIKTIKTREIKGKGVISVMKTMAKNLDQKSKGCQYAENEDYTDLFEAIYILGGAKTCVFAADNLDGPNIDHIREWMKKGTFVYDFHNPRINIEYISEYYRTCKEKIGEQRHVPYLVAEDETAIKLRTSYDERLDCVWGFCGLEKDHKCSSTHLIHVGNDHHYGKLLELMKNSRLASYARVMMINPLHERLSQIVLHLQPTCNCFTVADVLEQWSMYDELCPKFEQKLRW